MERGEPGPHIPASPAWCSEPATGSRWGVSEAAGGAGSPNRADTPWRHWGLWPRAWFLCPGLGPCVGGVWGAGASPLWFLTSGAGAL